MQTVSAAITPYRYAGSQLPTVGWVVRLVAGSAAGLRRVDLTCSLIALAPRLGRFGRATSQGIPDEPACGVFANVPPALSASRQTVIR
ncbi:hypothetical protein GCM10010492_67980 [Saccharothrix mutabilis subsp. mutabilis]|uniref:Uncharacterized protein n=1 Tax=Saccharothrix mutabilis subsp. mutabilis TaxID=66855 RepID=A0ABN0UPR7_9PSEU